MQPPDSPTRRDFRELIALMIPLALVQVGYTALGFVDTAIAGLAGGNSIAAVGLGGSLFYCFAVLGYGTALGVDPLVSQALGAGDPVHARRVLWNGIYVAGVVTLPLTLIMLVVAMSLSQFGVIDDVAQGTLAYVLGRAPSLFPLICAATMRGYLQASRRASVILWAVLVANLVNGPGSYALLRGIPALHIPALGPFGIGLAATIGTIGQLLTLMWAVRRITLAKAPERYRRLDRFIFTQLITVGMPVGLQMLAEVGAFTLVGVFMARLSAIAMAGHQVALMMASVSFSICVGMGSATSVQVGRAIGAGDSNATRRAGKLGFTCAGAVMLLAAIVMAAIPHVIVRIMTDDPEVAHQAALLLRIAAVFQIVDGIQAVGAGALRGAGMTNVAFIANLVGHWAVGLPLALLLTFGLGMGAQGLWWGLTIGLAVVAAWLTAAFFKASAKPIVALKRATMHH